MTPCTLVFDLKPNDNTGQSMPLFRIAFVSLLHAVRSALWACT